MTRTTMQLTSPTRRQPYKILNRADAGGIAGVGEIIRGVRMMGGGLVLALFNSKKRRR